jgi:hypothetical protein
MGITGSHVALRTWRVRVVFGGLGALVAALLVAAGAGTADAADGPGLGPASPIPTLTGTPGPPRSTCLATVVPNQWTDPDC